uniref:hypothetical protein n=1 Tax=Anaerotruncus massiliensis (ex Liu et al. 2021) TaxID=2321404 RepID=UPI003A89BD44
VAYFAFLTLPALVLPAWEMGMQGMALLITAASLSPAALAAYLVVPLARRRAAGFRGNRIFLAVAPLLPLYMPWQMLLLLAAFALPALDAAAAESAAAGMDEGQLDAFCKGFAGKAPAFLQLGGKPEKPSDNGAFCI